VLEVADLHVHYGGVTAVRDVALTVASGEFVSLLGANGAGKSSLLKAVMGVVRSDGRITLDGVAIGGRLAHLVARSGVRYVPEGGGVLAELTVIDNLMLGVRSRGRKARDAAVHEAVDLFPALGARLTSLGGELSGGERQMVALARAINARPQVLLLDEPSLGLAPVIVEQVYSRLDDIRDSGVAILLAEQNARNALAACDRGYVMQRGSVVASGSGEELREREDMVSFYLG